MDSMKPNHPSNELWTGARVRELRDSFRLSRRELAAHLKVAEVTIEKWEQAPEKVIRAKYSEPLNSIAGGGFAGVVLGAIAAPALAGPALLVALAGLVGGSLADEELDRITMQLNALKKLTPDERQDLFRLLRKLDS